MYIKTFRETTNEDEAVRLYYENTKLICILYCYEYNINYGEEGHGDTVDSSLLQVPNVRQYKIYIYKSLLLTVSPKH